MGHKLVNLNSAAIPLRGRVNSAPITADSVLDIGLRLAANHVGTDRRRVAIVGKDTRLSGYMLEAALTAGLTAGGMDVSLAGPLPTAGIAMLTRSLRADVGIAITASHNPAEDNGLKLFGPDGRGHLCDLSGSSGDERANDPYAPADQIGRIRRLVDADARYIEHLKRALPCGLLEGLRIVVDCANGAAYRCAPALFREMGADVHAIGTEPDGHNINRNAGALAPTAMIDSVREHGAHLGIAFDGDADRVAIADETGSLIASDQLLALFTRAWLESGMLRGGGVVGTVNSNTALERYIRTLGLEFVRSDVGDHHLVHTMQAHGMNLGAEHSGHLVFGDALPTSDGLLAALQVASLLAPSGHPASSLLHVFEPIPQLFIDVPLHASQQGPREEAMEAINEWQQHLNGSGRIVVRESRTEAVIRVMVEAESQTLVHNIAKGVTGTLRGLRNVQINAAE